MSLVSESFIYSAVNLNSLFFLLFNNLSIISSSDNAFKLLCDNNCSKVFLDANTFLDISSIFPNFNQLFIVLSISSSSSFAIFLSFLINACLVIIIDEFSFLFLFSDKYLDNISFFAKTFLTSSIGISLPLITALQLAILLFSKLSFNCILFFKPDSSSNNSIS